MIDQSYKSLNRFDYKTNLIKYYKLLEILKLHYNNLIIT